MLQCHLPDMYRRVCSVKAKLLLLTLKCSSWGFGFIHIWESWIGFKVNQCFQMLHGVWVLAVSCKYGIDEEPHMAYNAWCILIWFCHRPCPCLICPRQVESAELVFSVDWCHVREWNYLFNDRNYLINHSHRQVLDHSGDRYAIGTICKPCENKTQLFRKDSMLAS